MAAKVVGAIRVERLVAGALVIVGIVGGISGRRILHVRRSVKMLLGVVWVLTSKAVEWQASEWAEE